MSRVLAQYRRGDGLDYFPSLFCVEDRRLPKLHSPIEQDIQVAQGLLGQRDLSEL